MFSVPQADWRERFYAVSDNSKVLQEQLEEMRATQKEKDNTISRLKSRLKELEEAFEKAYKLSDNKNTRLQEENKMFQNVSKKMDNGVGRGLTASPGCEKYSGMSEGTTRKQKFLSWLLTRLGVEGHCGPKRYFKNNYLRQQVCTWCGSPCNSLSREFYYS